MAPYGVQATALHALTVVSLIVKFLVTPDASQEQLLCPSSLSTQVTLEVTLRRPISPSIRFKHVTSREQLLDCPLTTVVSVHSIADRFPPGKST